MDRCVCRELFEELPRSLQEVTKAPASLAVLALHSLPRFLRFFHFGIVVDRLRNCGWQLLCFLEHSLIRSVFSMLTL